ncbi:MAG: alcohol dehydrogenase catalytic domain-containing protein [Nitriliruptorales bacterium]|nr:alcohol dehydrogenase catalytic domain-containing protein [Nitriliruptorales bacterium]
MKAAITTTPGTVEVLDVPSPYVEDQALVALERMGLCGTDVKVLQGTVPVERPRILGHELVGFVVEPGPLGLVSAGQRVMVNPSLSCGHCRECRRGAPHRCSNGALLGRDVDGGFAELLAIGERQLHVVPDGVSSEASSSLQVLGTCVHAQHMIEVFPGQTAVVVGLGVSGFLMLQLLRARGIERVVGVTRAAWKQELAKELGAIAVATPDQAADVVADVTSGNGADVVVEAVGTTGTLAQAISLAGIGATVCLFGTITASKADALPFYDLYYKELTLRNPRAATASDYDEAIRLAASDIVQLRPLWTHGFALDEVAQAFEALNDPTALKVTLQA